MQSCNSPAVEVDTQPCLIPSEDIPESISLNLDVDILEDASRSLVTPTPSSRIASVTPSEYSRTDGRVRKHKYIYTSNTVQSIRGQIARLKRTIRSLEEEHEILKDYTVSVILEKEQLEQDMATLRGNYYDELAQGKEHRVQLQSTQAEVARLRSRFANAERFILALVDLGLEFPILREAVSSVLREERPGEDALIDAVQKAALLKGQAVSKVFPSIDGTRTIDHYLSALNLTISTRKELKEKAKVAQFWKMVAKSDPTNAETLTPSPSDLDQVEALSHPATVSHASLVDDLVLQLKDVLMEGPSNRPQCEPRNQRTADPLLPRLNTDLRNATSLTMGNTASSSKSTSGSDNSFLKRFAQDEQRGKSGIPRRQGGRGRRVSFSSLFLASNSNVPEDSFYVPNSMQSLSGAAKRLSDSNLSSKLTGRGNDVGIRPSQTYDFASSSFLASSSFGPASSNVSLSNSQDRHRGNRMSYPFACSPSTTSRNRQISALLGTPDDPSSGTFRACQALLSLERICAAFSTSSLGSVGGSEEESAERGAQSWFTDSNSTASSTGDLESSDVSNVLPRRGQELCTVSSGSSDDSFHSTKDEISEDRHISAPANAYSEVGNENTSRPPVVPPPVYTQAPPRKTVKWASPLSPTDRDRPDSIISNTTTSSSSFSDHPPSRVRPLKFVKGRSRAPSSPTPASTASAGRKSAIRSAKSSLSKTSRILKPMPALVISSTTKPLTPTKSKARLPPLSSSPPHHIPAPVVFSCGSKPPVVPPRSPLRPNVSPTIGGDHEKCTQSPPLVDAPAFNYPTKIRTSGGAGPRSSNLPRSPSRGQAPAYDYTSPIMPLKVIKKSSARSLKTGSVGPVSRAPRLSLPPSTIPEAPTPAKKQQGDAVPKQVSSVGSPPRLRPPHLPSQDCTTEHQATAAPGDDTCAISDNSSSLVRTSSDTSSPFDSSGEARSSASTADTEHRQTSDTKPGPLPSCNVQLPIDPRSSNGSVHSSKSTTAADAGTKRLSADFTSTAKDAQAKKVRPLAHNVVPPMRSSSLQPPRVLQAAALKRPQLGPLHPMRPRGVVEPKASGSGSSFQALPSQGVPTPQTTIVEGRPESKEATVGTSEGGVECDRAEPEAKERPLEEASAVKADEPPERPALVQLYNHSTMPAPSPPITPSIPSHASVPEPGETRAPEMKDSPHTSPFTKLRMTVLPSSSLVRSFSASKQDMVAQQNGVLGVGLGLGLIKRERAASNAAAAAGRDQDGKSHRTLGALHCPKVVLKQVQVTGARRHGSRTGILCNVSPKGSHSSKIRSP